MGMFEHREDPLLPRPQYYRRLANFASMALGAVAVCLLAGMCGYRLFEHMSWTDAFVNAAMILSGMGPVSNLQSSGGKILAGLYALFSGLAFMVSLGILLAPVLHRFLHNFHLGNSPKPRR
jgi:hypothetical protein